MNQKRASNVPSLHAIIILLGDLRNSRASPIGDLRRSRASPVGAAGGRLLARVPPDDIEPWRTRLQLMKEDWRRGDTAARQLAWRNQGRKNLNFWCDPGRFWEVPGGFRRDSWGGLRPPRPPHMVVCTPATPFLDFGVYLFVILGTFFRRFRHFCRQKNEIV